jgi:hypothetical protein
MLDYHKSIPCTRRNISISYFVLFWVMSTEVPNQHVRVFSLTVVKLPLNIRETWQPLIINICGTVRIHTGTILFCVSQSTELYLWEYKITFVLLCLSNTEKEKGPNGYEPNYSVFIFSIRWLNTHRLYLQFTETMQPLGIINMRKDVGYTESESYTASMLQCWQLSAFRSS